MHNATASPRCQSTSRARTGSARSPPHRLARIRCRIARFAPNKRELDALAYAGAFAAFGLTRREALWQAAAAERDPQSLFAGIDAVAGDENDPPAATRAPLPEMAPVEETLADYSSTGVTIGPHLMD